MKIFDLILGVFVGKKGKAVLGARIRPGFLQSSDWGKEGNGFDVSN